MIQMTSRLQTRGAVAQAISRYPVVTENRVRCKASSSEICGGRSGLKEGFSKKYRLFHLRISSPVLRTRHLHATLVRRTSGRSL